MNRVHIADPFGNRIELVERMPAASSGDIG
jgi:hypothetical protein